MSVEYNTYIVVGFLVDRDVFLKAFKKDTNKYGYFGDRHFTQVDDLIESLEKDLRCSISLHGNCWTGDDLAFGVSSRLMTHRNEVPIQGVTTELLADLARLHEVFNAFGVDLGVAAIRSVQDVT